MSCDRADSGGKHQATYGKPAQTATPVRTHHSSHEDPRGLTLLSKTRDAASLSRMAKLADTFGDRRATLDRIGANSFVRTA
jgi:hypothetical protein